MAILTPEQILNFKLDPPPETFFSFVHHALARRKDPFIKVFGDVQEEFYPGLFDAWQEYASKRDAASVQLRVAMDRIYNEIDVSAYVRWCRANDIESQIFTYIFGGDSNA